MQFKAILKSYKVDQDGESSITLLVPQEDLATVVKIVAMTNEVLSVDIALESEVSNGIA